MPLITNTLPTMSESAKKSLVIFTYIVLVLSTLLVFWQVRNFDFVNYDDNDYVSENPQVLSGLSHDGIIWAFTTGHSSNWHPLTWLSHMLDCQLFGPDPGWMHLVNVLLHLANTLLLFTVLKKMTGSLWPSAFVAAAFALHPMHVESVAWISERKDVLSTLFLLLTLMAYVGYVKRPSVFRYLTTLALFAVGLMAKPMLVTLPLLLVLLDYWPLNRLTPQPIELSGRKSLKSVSPGVRNSVLYQVMIEKVPFFFISIVSCVITFLVQLAGGAVADITIRPGHIRVANAFLSYAKYIGKMFWPRDLAILYPFHTGGIPFWQVATGVLLLLVISILVIWLGRRRKYLPVGWFWFVSTLLPVIGLIQVGDQAYADRYTYIPYIGLFVMIAWGLPELLSKWPQRKTILGIAAAIALTAMGIGTYRQVSYWKNSSTLFTHAIEATQNNYLAYDVRGIAYGKLGRYQEAIEDFRQAIKFRPDYVEAHSNLGVAYGGLGRSQEAIEAFGQAIMIDPDYAEVRYNLAKELAGQGRCDEAVDQYRTILRLKGDWPDPMNNLAWLIATNPRIKNRDTNEAVRLARGACEIANYKDLAFLDTLAAAYASVGRFGEAVDTDNKALYLADATNQPQVKDTIRYHLSFYTQGKPYIEPASKSLPDPNKP
jgi:Flp pilus assembly protein TadD